MKFLDVLFYYYYLIYTKEITTTTPLETTIFCLGFCMGFPLFCIIDFILTFFCLEVGQIAYFLIAGFPIITLYFLYWRTGRYRQVLKQKPKFFNSHKKTKVIVGVFFVFTASFMLWGVFPVHALGNYLGCDNRTAIDDIVKEKITSLFSK